MCVSLCVCDMLFSCVSLIGECVCVCVCVWVWVLVDGYSADLQVLNSAGGGGVTGLLSQ